MNKDEFIKEWKHITDVNEAAMQVVNSMSGAKGLGTLIRELEKAKDREVNFLAKVICQILESDAQPSRQD